MKGDERLGRSAGRLRLSRPVEDAPLSRQLRRAAPQIKRQTFEAFGLRIDYDKAERTINLSATVIKAVADAFENANGLPEVAFQAANGVTVSDIAGARFVSRSDARIRREYRMAA